jgi:hypothetical protein
MASQCEWIACGLSAGSLIASPGHETAAAFSRTAGLASGLSFPEQGIAAHAKIAPLLQNPTMDIERVNAIGTLLTDLAARTSALRGYL